MLNKPHEAIIKQEPAKFNKPNVLVKIALSKALTARDKKIYNILIRELLMLNVAKFKNNEVKLSITKLSKLLGITSRNDLYKSLEKLLNTIITFENHQYKTRATMISSYSRPIETLLDLQDDDVENINTYSQDNLIIRFDTKLTRTILKYADTYSKLDLIDINNLKVSHAITLYEIFIRTLGTHQYQKVHYTEEELRKYLHLENKYLDIKLFNQAVIKKSITEINIKTKLSVDFKREKINNENIYKFEVNQDYKYNFKKFKNCITKNYHSIEFSYNKKRYMILKNLDSKNKIYDEKFYICNAATLKNLTKEKASEIYEFMYNLLQKNSIEFVYRFISCKKLEDEYYKDFSLEELEDIDIEEANNFHEKYLESQVS